MMRHVNTLVIGAGPTGLGAACRLEEYREDYLLVDENQCAGGLAGTDRTPEGFLFDLGCVIPIAPQKRSPRTHAQSGHVIFSHFDYFDALLQQALGPFENEKAWATHQRESYVRYKDMWVPYPLQNNLSCLPVEDQIAALNGMVAAKVQAAATPGRLPANFDEWILGTMGPGMADLFMRPYNFKVWATPTPLMQWSWLGERVSVVDVDKAISNVLLKKIDKSWGPNAIFRFPCNGGTGAIWRAVEQVLPPARLQLNTRLIRVDLDRQVAVLQRATGSGGSVVEEQVHYDRLLSTSALDLFATHAVVQDEADRAMLHAGASQLAYSSTHVIGLGIRGANPHGTKCWLYFHEANCPFYRATVFSNYGPGNCPNADVKLETLRGAAQPGPVVAGSAAASGPYWSLMLEVSESKHKPVDMATALEETIQGCLRAGLLAANDEIVSTYHRRIERGYPTPSLERDAGLRKLLPILRARNVWSRGRFGCWKYEVGNQDHSLALGVEAVDAMLAGLDEVTLNKPGYVNRNVGSAKNATPAWQKPPPRRALAPVGADEFVVQGYTYATKVAQLRRRWFATLEEYSAYVRELA